MAQMRACCAAPLTSAAWAAIAGAAYARELEVGAQLAAAQQRAAAAQAVQEASSSPSTRRRFWLPSWRRRLQQGGDDGFMEPMQKHSINGGALCGWGGVWVWV